MLSEFDHEGFARWHCVVWRSRVYWNLAQRSTGRRCGQISPLPVSLPFGWSETFRLSWSLMN